jgi:hypothetical protein
VYGDARCAEVWLVDNYELYVRRHEEAREDQRRVSYSDQPEVKKCRSVLRRGKSLTRFEVRTAPRMNSIRRFGICMGEQEVGPFQQAIVFIRMG